MIAAVVIAILVMLVAAEPDGALRQPPPDREDAGAVVPPAGRHGADGGRAHVHIPRGYLYSAIAFSAVVEGLNLMGGRGPATAARGRQPPAARLSGAARYARCRSGLDVTRATCGKSTRRTGVLTACNVPHQAPRVPAPKRTAEGERDSPARCLEATEWNPHAYRRIESSPKFRELVGARTRFAVTLTVIMLVIYFGFILASSPSRPACSASRSASVAS